MFDYMRLQIINSTTYVAWIFQWNVHVLSCLNTWLSFFNQPTNHVQVMTDSLIKAMFLRITVEISLLNLFLFLLSSFLNNMTTTVSLFLFLLVFYNILWLLLVLQFHSVYSDISISKQMIYFNYRLVNTRLQVVLLLVLYSLFSSL